MINFDLFHAVASLTKDDATPINDAAQNIHGSSVIDSTDTTKEKSLTKYKIAAENEYANLPRIYD